MKYHVVVTRDGDGWMADVPALPGTHTWAKTLRALDRGVREDACRLADPADGHAALRALPGGQDVADAWRSRDQALAAYYEALTAQRDPGTALRTLLHEHHMRALGIDPDLERQTGRCARAAALRRLALDTRS